MEKEWDATRSRNQGKREQNKKKKVKVCIITISFRYFSPINLDKERRGKKKRISCHPPPRRAVSSCVLNILLLSLLRSPDIEEGHELCDWSTKKYVLFGQSLFFCRAHRSHLLLLGSPPPSTAIDCVIQLTYQMD